jgi:hypothetical protein
MVPDTAPPPRHGEERGRIGRGAVRRAGAEKNGAVRRHHAGKVEGHGGQQPAEPLPQQVEIPRPHRCLHVTSAREQGNRQERGTHAVVVDLPRRVEVLRNAGLCLPENGAVDQLSADDKGEPPHQEGHAHGACNESRAS